MRYNPVMKKVVVGLLISSMLVSFMIPLSGVASADINADFLGSSPGRFNSIKVLDIDEDGKTEIVFGNYEGHLNILETVGGSYIEEWRSESLGTRLWGVEVGDVDGDDVNEVIVGSGEGYVYVYDAVTHELEWKSGELVRDAHGIAIGDVNGDGDNDLVIGTGYKTDIPWSYVYVFNGKNKSLIGTIGNFDSRIRSISIVDVDQDGANEIVFGSGVALGETAGEGYIYIYGYNDGEFTREWKSDDLNGDVNGLVVHDLDGDQKLEIIASNGYRYTPGYVYIFRYRGGIGGVGTPNIYDQVWVSEDIGPKAYGLAVGDIDHDGITELVLGNQPGYIWIFDAVNLQLEWKSELLGTDILGIALYDLDLDGQMEIIAAQGGYQGKADFTSAYTTPHIFVINGKTRTIESKLGEPDFIAWGFQIVIVLLIILLLVGLNSYFRFRKKKSSEKSPEDKSHQDKEVIESSEN
jgi:hypothetical protein